MHNKAHKGPKLLLLSKNRAIFVQMEAKYSHEESSEGANEVESVDFSAPGSIN